MTKSKTIQTYKKIFKSYIESNKVPNENIAMLLEKFIGRLVSLLGVDIRNVGRVGLDEDEKKLKGIKILDVGCAQGRDCKYFADRGFDVTGIDLTPEFIEIGKKNLPDVKFRLMDMRTLDFEEQSFDALWVCASFLHLPKKYALETLKGFKRVLKSNGIMFISVMQGESEGFRKNEKMNWDDRYFSFYKKDELEKLFLEVGFKVDELVEVQTHWGPVFLDYLVSIN